VNAEGERNRLRELVLSAAQAADARYRELVDVSGLTRAEYVGRSVILVLDTAAPGPAPTPSFVGFWMNETGGVLQPAVFAYLKQEPMTLEQIALMRAYLRQWIASPYWQGPTIDELRSGIDSLITVPAIDRWLEAALHAGIDPL
jgi:hypothetical protein